MNCFTSRCRLIRGRRVAAVKQRQLSAFIIIMTEWITLYDEVTEESMRMETGLLSHIFWHYAANSSCWIKHGQSFWVVTLTLPVSLHSANVLYSPLLLNVHSVNNEEYTSQCEWFRVIGEWFSTFLSKNKCAWLQKSFSNFYHQQIRDTQYSYGTMTW